MLRTGAEVQLLLHGGDGRWLLRLSMICDTSKPADLLPVVGDAV